MKLKLLPFGVAVLTCAIYGATAQESSTAEAERYIKESERQWAEVDVTRDSTVVERILADVAKLEMA